MPSSKGRGAGAEMAPSRAMQRLRRIANGCTFGRMPKMQVYLPADLHERVRMRSDRLNVSNVLQRALELELAELERREALDSAVSAYESKQGRFTASELRAREA